MTALQDFINSVKDAASHVNNYAKGVNEDNVRKNSTEVVPNAITSFANSAGQAIGNQPILPKFADPFPALTGHRAPTISQAYDYTAGDNGGLGLPGGDILKGKATPASLAALGLTAGTMALGGGNPESESEVVPEENMAETGSTLTRVPESEHGNPSFNTVSPESPQPVEPRPDSPLNGNENMSMNKSVPPAGEVPSEPVQPSVGNKSGKNPVTVTLPKYKDNPNFSTKEAEAQATLDQYVPGKSAEEVANNLPKVMDNFGKQIKDAMATNPKVTSPETLKADFNQNLMDQGFYNGETVKAKTALQRQMRQYVKDFAAQVTKADANGNPIITDQDLYSMKQKANAETQAAQQKRLTGGSLTDKEKVMLVARDTIDKTLTDLHPEVKELSIKQSHLYDASPSVYDARQSERANPKSSFLDVLKKHPLVSGVGGAVGSTALLGGVGAGVMALGNKINPGSGVDPLNQTQSSVNNVNNTPENNVGNNNVQGNTGQNLDSGGTLHSDSMVSQGKTNVNKLETDYTKVNPMQDGKYTVPNPFNLVSDNGSPAAISVAQKNAAELSINAYRAQHPNDPVAAAQADYNQSLVDNMDKASEPIRQEYDKASKAMNDINAAMVFLDNKDAGFGGQPNFLDALNVGGIGVPTFQGANSNYKNMLQAVGAIQAAYPDIKLDPASFISVDSAKKALDLAAKKITSGFNTIVKNQSQGLPPTPPPLGGSPRTNINVQGGSNLPPVNDSFDGSAITGGTWQRPTMIQ